MRVAALVLPWVFVSTMTLLHGPAGAGSIPGKPPYESSKLDTGLELVTMRAHKVPLVTIVLVCKAGAMTELPDTNGLTHLWEHMFFKGNRRIPNQEAFNRRIRQLGIVYNGDTSAEKVRYYFTLPSAFLDEGMAFMADAISSPLLEQVELEKERRVVLNEYERSAAQPAFDYNNLERILIYGKQAHLRDPLGRRREIENASREQLFKIKDEVFVPSNCALVVGGDFEQQKLRQSVEKHFASWKDPKDWKPVNRGPFPPFPPSQKFVMTRPAARNASVQITFAGPKARTEPNDSYAADVLISLLNHKGGRFYKKFEDSGLCYEAGLNYHTQSQAGELTLFGVTDAINAEKVRAELLAEIDAWQKPDYFTESQLVDVRRNLLINHKRDVNQTSEYTKTLAFWWAVTGLDYYGTYLDHMSKTGFAEVQAFIKRWLVGKTHITSILTSPEEAKKSGLVDDSKPLVDKLLSDYYSSAKQDGGAAQKSGQSGAIQPGKSAAPKPTNKG